MPFRLIFWQYCPQNLWHFEDEDVPITGPKQFVYYIEFIIYKQGYVKKKTKSEFHVLIWYRVLQNLDVFLEDLL